MPLYCIILDTCSLDFLGVDDFLVVNGFLLAKAFKGLSTFVGVGNFLIKSLRERWAGRAEILFDWFDDLY